MTNYPNIITPYITSANENRVAYTLNDASKIFIINSTTE